MSEDKLLFEKQSERIGVRISLFPHISMLFRLSQSLHEAENETRPAWPSSFNVFVMLRNFVCKIGEDADILVNIYDAKEGRFIRYVQ
jgi:hypothetical protein